MKRMKKFVSVLLAVIMVLGMSVTVFAADNNDYTITVNKSSSDSTTHTYEAYQIFAGDLATDDTGDKILSNIVWGSGVNGDTLLAALKEEATFNGAFDECTNAADVAKVLEGNAFQSSSVSESTLTDTFARVVEANLTNTVAGTATGTNVTIPVKGAGYYLVKDKDDSVEANGAYTRFLLEVVGNATATVKSDVPHGDKQIYVEPTSTTDTDGNTTTVIGTGDANNAPIGAHVSYEITSEVPNYTGYNYYYFIMNDTLSEGLTFDGASSVAVKVGGATLIQGTDYYVYTGEDVAPMTFRLAFENIKDYAIGAKIVVTYSATVNNKAVVGTTGNPNTWSLQYSNNPGDTFDGEGRPDDENKPGLPADEENEALGETPKEKTLTYVTKLDITKYANSVAVDHLLAGAEFTLTGTSKQVVLKNVEYYEASENGTYYLLLDGTYTETAPTGTTYVEIGVGTKDTTTGYIKDGDNYIVPADKTQYEGKTLYKLVKGTAATYADVNTKYVKTKAIDTVYVDADVSIEMTTDSEGKISFTDLGAGTYTLTETVTPAGFNTLDPITFTITFTPPEKVTNGIEECTWTIDWTGAKEEGGIFAADVINNSGSLLPSTGGIGTTIFYVVGGILVIGAGILLVAKKRMSANK